MKPRHPAALFALLLCAVWSDLSFAQQEKRPPEPPPEAYAACKDKQEGDRAEFTGRQGETVSGSCQSKDGKLFLKPDHPPAEAQQGKGRPRPDEGQPPEPPPEAYAACKDKQEGDRAEFTGKQGETVSGSCQSKDGKLFLKPDHPPKQAGGGAGR